MVVKWISAETLSAPLGGDASLPAGSNFSPTSFVDDRSLAARGDRPLNPTPDASSTRVDTP